MKKRILAVTMVMMILCMSIPAFAKSGVYNNGEFSITCSNTCTASKGTGSTKGAPYGYKNTVSLTILNSNGVSLGNNTSTTPYDFIASTSKSDSKGRIYSNKTGHYVKDSDGNPAEPLYKQVVLVVNK